MPSPPYAYQVPTISGSPSVVASRPGRRTFRAPGRPSLGRASGFRIRAPSSPSRTAHGHSQASRWEAPLGAGGGPAPSSHQSPFSTWWQVKDLDLRSFRDGFTAPSGKPVNSDNACPPTHFRAYSPQIADYIRRQPDSPANNSRVHYFAPRRRDPMPQTRAVMVEIAHQLTSPSAKVDILSAWP